MVVQLAFDDGAVIVDPLALPDLRPLRGSARADDGRRARAFVRFEDLCRPLRSSCRRTCSIRRSRPRFSDSACRSRSPIWCASSRTCALPKSQTVSDWSTRPLSHKQLDYLVDDVAHLLPMHEQADGAAGGERAARVGARGVRRAWRHRALSHRRTPRVSAHSGRDAHEPARTRRAQRTREAARPDQARERDLPPKYIIPDDVVAGLATLRPKRVEDLEQLRRLDAGARRSSARRSSRRSRAARRLPEDELPERPQRPLGPAATRWPR